MTSQTITLSQTASWNSRLTNPYRTRWATAAGRFFKVSADYLGDLWTIEEVTEAGELLVISRPDPRDFAAIANPDVYTFGFSAFAFTLTEAREKIAAEVAE